jgi:hypothetical protein
MGVTRVFPEPEPEDGALPRPQRRQKAPDTIARPPCPPTGPGRCRALWRSCPDACVDVRRFIPPDVQPSHGVPPHDTQRVRSRPCHPTSSPGDPDGPRTRLVSQVSEHREQLACGTPPNPARPLSAAAPASSHIPIGTATELGRSDKEPFGSFALHGSSGLRSPLASRSRCAFTKVILPRIIEFPYENPPR